MDPKQKPDENGDQILPNNPEQHTVSPDVIESTEAKEARTKLGGTVERGDLKDTIEREKAETVLSEDVTRNLEVKNDEEFESVGEKAHHWNPFTEAGLEEMKAEMIALGFDKKNPALFDMHFKELRKTFEEEGRVLEEKFYKTPDLYTDILREKDKGFYEAWMFYKAAQNEMTESSRAYKMLETSIKADKGFPTLTKIWDGSVDFLRDTDKARRAGDWPKFAVQTAVALGIGYGLWRFIKRQFSDRQTNLEKYGLIGIGSLVLVHHVLKKQGVDVFKMIGAKPEFEEVKNTQMEALAAMGGREAREIDGDTFVEVGLVDMGSLAEQYHKAKIRVANGQEGYIDPAQFSDDVVFTKFAGRVWDVHSVDDKEYHKAGQDLYKIMEIMESAYEAKTDNSFELAMADARMKEMSVVDFTGTTLAPHYSGDLSEWWIERKDQGVQLAKSGATKGAKIAKATGSKVAEGAKDLGAKAKSGAEEAAKKLEDKFNDLRYGDGGSSEDPYYT